MNDVPPPEAETSANVSATARVVGTVTAVVGVLLIAVGVVLMWNAIMRGNDYGLAGVAVLTAGFGYAAFSAGMWKRRTGVWTG